MAQNFGKTFVQNSSTKNITPTKSFYHYTEQLTLILIGLYYLNVTVPFITSKIVLLGIHIFALFSVLININRIAFVATRNLLFLSPFILSILSLLWTNTFFVSLSGVRLLILSFFLSCYVAVKYTLKQQLKLFSSIFIIVILLSFFWEILGLNPGASEWRGVFPHKNGLAIYMVIAFFQLLNIILFRDELKAKVTKIAYFVFLILALILLFLSQGKAALAVFFLCIPTYYLKWAIYQKTQKTRLFSILLFIYMAITLITISVMTSNYIVVEILGKDLTYNGRTEIWAYLIDRVNTSRPLLGFGYRGFWQDPNEWKAMQNELPWLLGLEGGGGNTHSGYMQAFLWLGWPGLLLLTSNLIVITVSAMKLFSKTKKMEYFGALQLILIVFLYNFSETTVSLFGDRNFGFFMFSCLALSLASDKARIRRKFEVEKNPYLIRQLIP